MFQNNPPPPSKKYYDIDAVNKHRRNLYFDQIEIHGTAIKIKNDYSKYKKENKE